MSSLVMKVSQHLDAFDGPVNLSQGKKQKQNKKPAELTCAHLFLLPFCLSVCACSNYPVEGSGGGLPAKVKKSRSNGSVKKAEARKSLSLEAAQLEIQQQQHKTLTRYVVVGGRGGWVGGGGAMEVF